MTDADLAQLELSLTSLAELTGLRRQTISSKLEAANVQFSTGERGSKVYKVRDALPHLFQLDNSNPEQGDKDRLARAKADLAELQLAEKRRELINSDEALELVATEYNAVRSQLLTWAPPSLAKWPQPTILKLVRLLSPTRSTPYS